MSNDLFRKVLAQTSPTPMGVEIHEGRGCRLFGPDGREYLDLISGISVSNVGHGDAAVTDAVCRQAKAYMHAMVYGEYVLSPQVQFAELLTAQLHPQLNQVYFVNSGSEAVEGALKLAKKFTGRKKILSFYNSYHGSTHGALSVTGGPDLWLKEGYGPFLPHVEFLHFNRTEDLKQIDKKTACVIIEPIQGEAGVRLPGHDFLKQLRHACDMAGALLIIDEIQTGFGRCGGLFAHQEFRIVPDILLVGKALGGGMPLGAFIASEHLMQALRENPVLGHITTFGGHPVSCAAGKAALEKILNEKLWENALRMEQVFRKKLVHPAVKEIRGKGLLLAAELEDAELVQKSIRFAIEKGILTDWFLHCDTALRIAPPLIITEDEVKEACSIIIESLEKALKS